MQAKGRDSLERETCINHCVHSFGGGIESLLYARHCKRCCR